MSRGAQKADDRDHLAFHRFMGEDLLAERLLKDRAGVRRRLLLTIGGTNTSPVGRGLHPPIDQIPTIRRASETTNLHFGAPNNHELVTAIRDEHFLLAATL